MVALPHSGCTIVFNNSDWEALYGYLRKAQRPWEVVAKVLMNMGATVRARVMTYKAVVQTVLL